MTGCFGNSDYDRNLERELMNHLDNESQFDNYLENIKEECYKIDLVLADSGDFEIFWSTSEICDQILNSHYKVKMSNFEIANGIIDAFIATSKWQYSAQNS